MSGTRPERPNVLVVMTDQHRYDWLGSNPDVPVRTPNIDALAERGVRFTNAVCPSPVCAPSRACVASGFEYDRCRVPSNGYDYPSGASTFYRRLRDRGGYHVTGSGKFDLGKGGPGRDLAGTAGLEGWGFSDGIDNVGKYGILFAADAPIDPYTAYLHDEGLARTHLDDYRRRRDDGLFAATYPTPLPEEAYLDNWIGRNARRFIGASPGDEPWFHVVNFAGPHSPMDVTERMHALYRGDDPVSFPGPVDSDEFSPAIHDEIRRNYAATITNIDEWVGRFVDVIRERGELDDTLIVFTADHGEMLGDHGLWNKRLPHQPSIGVPLVVAGPGVVPRDPSDAPVSLLDLHATVLDVAGVEPRPGVDSRSFRPVVEGTHERHREYVRSGLGHWRVVFDGRYKLVTGFDPDHPKERFDTEFWDRWEISEDGLVPPPDPNLPSRDIVEHVPPLLFDLENDRHERENVAEDRPDLVGELAPHIPFY